MVADYARSPTDFGAPQTCHAHHERACLCETTPCPCHCHGERPIVCQACSKKTPPANIRIRRWGGYDRIRARKGRVALICIGCLPDKVTA